MVVKINNSSALISYKETVLNIGAGETKVYQNPYNFLRILSSTGSDNDLVYRFGTSSIETYLTVGLGLRWPEVLPSVTIRNLSNSPVILRIAEIQGDVLDDRLTITGDVETKQEPDQTATVTLETFDANGEIAIDSSSYRSVLIQNMSQTEDVYIFNNNTFKIGPNGTFEKQFAGSFNIYGTPGETVSVGYFK